MPESVAIVHDWLTSMRGGERVVEVLCRVFPQADLFTLTWDSARLSPALARRRVTTSPIHRVARAPFVNGRFRALLPLFPLAVESFNLERYSLVVSSSHCVAMGAIAAPTALHVAYMHSTLRYAREARATYEDSVPGGPLGVALFRGTAHYLRRWERRASVRPHVFIANSTYTRERIRRYYDRDAMVIPPPIDTERFERAANAARRAPDDPRAPYLLVSALVPNKRVDLALRAFQGRTERLIVVGEGPERARLEALVGPNVTLLSRVDEARLADLFARSRALLHTGVDDFGMVMVEALAAGRPVLACAEGGALDIVRDGETGLLIEQPTVESVRRTLDRFAAMTAQGLQGSTFDPASLQRYAKSFDHASFERHFAGVVDEARCRHGRGIKTNGHGRAGANGTSWSLAAAPPSPPKTIPTAPTASHAQPPQAPRASVPDPPPKTRTAWDHAAKRALDITLAATGLVVTAPVLLALSALVPLDSRGPAFFYQERLGQGERPFTMVKLRTMDDRARVTRLGRLLRPTGLDELPQLWNVLKGDMSLIGPRPEVRARVVRFEAEIPGYGKRHAMRPGITGWAQVNGLRGNVSIARRLAFDLEYLREWDLRMDARILLSTVRTVVWDTIRELGLPGNHGGGARRT